MNDELQELLVKKIKELEKQIEENGPMEYCEFNTEVLSIVEDEIDELRKNFTTLIYDLGIIRVRTKDERDY